MFKCLTHDIKYVTMTTNSKHKHDGVYEVSCIEVQEPISNKYNVI